MFAWCPDDDPLGASLLADHGYVLVDDGGVSGWMATADAPSVSPLADGYRLQSRADRPDGPHPFVARNGPAVEDRLRQTSHYRPDLDLVVVTEADECAGYALCRYDPVTRVGLVEPMRTEDGHQRRGLARHLLVSGLRRLVDLDAEHIRISWEADNPASSARYPDVGSSRRSGCTSTRRNAEQRLAHSVVETQAPLVSSQPMAGCATANPEGCASGSCPLGGEPPPTMSRST